MPTFVEIYEETGTEYEWRFVFGCDIIVGAKNPLSIYRPTKSYCIDESHPRVGGTVLYCPNYYRYRLE
jgi:hypothetical protein